MLRQIIRHRRTILYLAMQQVRDRYLGTMGGAIWVVLQPLLLLLVFWVVFSQGFRVQVTSGQAFILVLFCGLISWTAFSDAVSGSVNAITGRAYLIKKIAFPVEILPMTHIVAAMATHAVMLVVLVGMLAWYRVWPGPGLLLFPYYLFAMGCFAASLSVLFSAVNVFYRDVSQGLAIIINVWFWATPIVWPAEMLPSRFAPMLDFNPMYYIVTGYRNVFLTPDIVLPDLRLTVFFWALTIGLWIVGSNVFQRLKPSFADVL